MHPSAPLPGAEWLIRLRRLSCWHTSHPCPLRIWTSEIWREESDTGGVGTPSAACETESPLSIANMDAEVRVTGAAGEAALAGVLL